MLLWPRSTSSPGAPALPPGISRSANVRISSGVGVTEEAGPDVEQEKDDWTSWPTRLPADAVHSTVLFTWTAATTAVSAYRTTLAARRVLYMTSTGADVLTTYYHQTQSPLRSCLPPC